MRRRGVRELHVREETQPVGAVHESPELVPLLPGVEGPEHVRVPGLKDTVTERPYHSYFRSDQHQSKFSQNLTKIVAIHQKS